MAKRLGKLQTFLQEQKLDALLIKSKTMKKYMDTLTGSGCQILLMKDRGFLIVDILVLLKSCCTNIPVKAWGWKAHSCW